MNADAAQVREDVQHIFGEEFRVWQWLPDLAWFVSLDIPLLKFRLSKGSWISTSISAISSEAYQHGKPADPSLSPKPSE